MTNIIYEVDNEIKDFERSINDLKFLKEKLIKYFPSKIEGAELYYNEAKCQIKFDILDTRMSWKNYINFDIYDDRIFCEIRLGKELAEEVWEITSDEDYREIGHLLRETLTKHNIKWED